MNNDFPQMLYRAEGVKIESRIINDAAELAEAISQGWGDRASAKAASVMPARTSVVVGAGAQAAKPAIDADELAKIKDALAASQEAAESAREYAKALGERVDTLETFLRDLAADEAAPEQLRADITALLGGEGAAVDEAAKPPAKKKATKK